MFALCRRLAQSEPQRRQTLWMFEMDHDPLAGASRCLRSLVHACWLV
jgi:hypothetical protein